MDIVVHNVVTNPAAPDGPSGNPFFDLPKRVHPGSSRFCFPQVVVLVVVMVVMVVVVAVVVVVSFFCLILVQDKILRGAVHVCSV